MKGFFTPLNPPGLNGVTGAALGLLKAAMRSRNELPEGFSDTTAGALLCCRGCVGWRSDELFDAEARKLASASEEDVAAGFVSNFRLDSSLSAGARAVGASEKSSWPSSDSTAFGRA